MTAILPELEAELSRRAGAEAGAKAEAETEAVHADPTLRARSHRRRASVASRRLPLTAALTAVVAALVVFTVLASPLGDRSRLDVVAEARAALDPSRAILHTVTVRRTGPFPKRVITRYSNGEELVSDHFELRSERWSTTKPERYREINQQAGFSRIARREEAYSDRRFTKVDGEQIRTVRLPAAEAQVLVNARSVAGALSGVGPFQDDPVVTLRALLDAGSIRPAGEIEVNGRRVVKLVPSDPAAERRFARAHQSDAGFLFPTEYLVDAKTYAPVRVTYKLPGEHIGQAGPDRTGHTAPVTSTITFTTFERLDPTTANERLLEIDPAGRKVLEDPDMFRGKKMRMVPRRTPGK